MTGWPLARACLVAWRFGELSQHKVMPHSWQVRKCIQGEPIFIQASQARSVGSLIVVIPEICAHVPFDMTFNVDP